MMDGVRLSMVSMNSVLGDTEVNLSRMLALCDAASSAGSDIVCFPELCLSGYSMPGSTELATTIDSPEIGEVVDKSSETGMCICFGFVDEGPRIAQAVVECGRILGVYHKTHLGEREAPVMVPGDSLDVIRTSKAVLGIQVCWEAHFPEISCTYALKGACAEGCRHPPDAVRLRTRRRAQTVVMGQDPARQGLRQHSLRRCLQRFRAHRLWHDAGRWCGRIRCQGEQDLRGLEPLETIRAEGYVSMKDVYFLDKRRPEIYFR